MKRLLSLSTRSSCARLVRGGWAAAAACLLSGAAAAWAQTNLALGKPASGSAPCNPNESPAKAVNGSTIGGNFDKWCSLAPVKFLDLDLGERFTLAAFMVRHAGAGNESPSFNTRDFTIQVSLDGTSFTTVVEVVGNGDNVTRHVIAPVAARFVRLNVLAAEQGQGGAARIYELEVYAVAPPPIGNMARARPAIGSAPCSADQAAAKAFNGSFTGGLTDKWCSRAGPRFVQVDLGGSYELGMFVVRHAGAGQEPTALNTRAFTIRVGDDPNRMATVVAVTDNTGSVSIHTTAPQRARFVRLDVTVPAQDGSTAANIYDLEVYAPPLRTIGACGSAGGVMYVQPYSSGLSRWCVHPDIWAGHAADVERFFAYGDSVIAYLQTLFAFTPRGLPFTFQATQVTGGASTGSNFGLGDSVTGDAFFNNFRDPVSREPIPGFFGFLLTLHEAINVWTGEMVGGGWPTDWWADHRSPFPNSMDFQIMRTIGDEQHDAVLQKAALAQTRRLGTPGLPGFDSEVKMFDDFFAQRGGFPAYARAFAAIQRDGLRWGELRPAGGGAPNPSPLLTEYVIAYLALGFRTDQDPTATFVAAGVGTKDTQIPPYSVDPVAVGDIADAHCGIAAADGDTSAALAALRRGDFQNARVAGACGERCPGECGCDSAANQCVARWRAR